MCRWDWHLLIIQLLDQLLLSCRFFCPLYFFSWTMNPCLISWKLSFLSPVRAPFWRPPEDSQNLRRGTGYSWCGLKQERHQMRQDGCDLKRREPTWKHDMEKDKSKAEILILERAATTCLTWRCQWWAGKWQRHWGEDLSGGTCVVGLVSFPLFF